MNLFYAFTSFCSPSSNQIRKIRSRSERKPYQVQTILMQLYWMFPHNIFIANDSMISAHIHMHLMSSWSCISPCMTLHICFSWGWRKLELINASATTPSPRSLKHQTLNRTHAFPRRAAPLLTSFLGILGVVFLNLDVLKRFMLSCWPRVWTFRVSRFCDDGRNACVWMSAFLCDAGVQILQPIDSLCRRCSKPRCLYISCVSAKNASGIRSFRIQLALTPI